MGNTNNPKGRVDDYSKIFNALQALSIIGVFFIVCSIPALAEPPEEEELNYKISTEPKIVIELPDVSYAFEVKANVETAKQHLDSLSSIYDYIDSVEAEIVIPPKTTYVGEFYITMYAATIEQCGSTSGITASGRKCTENPECHTVAVDPSVIPLGSYLIIEGYDGIIFRADDTGSAINGYDIDIYTDSEAESKSFNNQSGVKVWIIED